MKLISFKINGEDKKLLINGNERLIDVIRDELHLTGTKEGCGQGECGACTVLLDGKAIPSCLTLAIKADRKEIITIEGLEKDGILHPVQQAFIEAGAIQCGFCTPGIVMSLVELLMKDKEITYEDIKRQLSGNICRCTGYQKIVKAAMLAHKKIRGEKNV